MGEGDVWPTCCKNCRLNISMALCFLFTNRLQGAARALHEVNVRCPVQRSELCGSIITDGQEFHARVVARVISLLAQPFGQFLQMARAVQAQVEVHGGTLNEVHLHHVLVEQGEYPRKTLL